MTLARWLVLVAFIVVGFNLDAQTRAHLKDASVPHRGLSLLWNPELFTARGNQLRRRALIFWLGGMAAWLLWLLW